MIIIITKSVLQSQGVLLIGFVAHVFDNYMVLADITNGFVCNMIVANFPWVMSSAMNMVHTVHKAGMRMMWIKPSAWLACICLDTSRAEWFLQNW